MTPSEETAGPETYFSERPRARSARREFRFLYRGELLNFVVDTGVFATHGLDAGTDLLIEHLGLRPTDAVLEVGCGWGAVGVAAARAADQGSVVLTEINRRAARLAQENLARNRVRNADVRVGSLYEPVGDATFDVVVSNPPYRAGRPVVLDLLRGAAPHLRPGGRLVIVGKGSQGILYYQGWLRENWAGEVTVLGRRSGYRVLEATLGAWGAEGEPAGAPPAEGLKNRAFLGQLPRGHRPVRTASRAASGVRTRESGTGE